MRDSSSDRWAGYERGSRWGSVLLLPVWAAAAVVAFVPFAFDTSPWDAVILRVPGNQGNWWHALAGAPFFLAFPMVWLRVRALAVERPLSALVRRVLLGIAMLSIAGTMAVETPFLLHLAGTSEWQRFVVLGFGFGIIVCSVAVLILRRRRIPAFSACVAGIETAYLANASLCLVVYSEATGSIWTRLGWFVSVVLVWPMGLELISILARSAGTSARVAGADSIVSRS